VAIIVLRMRNTARERRRLEAELAEQRTAAAPPERELERV
jgi:hypothetical protein